MLVSSGERGFDVYQLLGCSRWAEVEVLGLEQNVLLKIQRPIANRVIARRHRDGGEVESGDVLGEEDGAESGAVLW